MKRACELCERTARIYCESDRASLCWVCDAKVHSANFLVARHSRSLLCRICQSPTPWSAAGSKLEPTFSDCRTCAAANRTGCDERDGEDREEAAEEKQDVVENQAIPWSPPPPPASESSLSGGEAAAATRKRSRLANDRHRNVGINIYATPSETAAEAASGAESKSRELATLPRKIRTADLHKARVSNSTVEATRSFRYKETVSGEEMAHGSGAVDLNLSLSLFS